MAPGLSNVVKVTVESLEERRPTCPRVPPEVLGPGLNPLPAGHSVVKGACQQASCSSNFTAVLMAAV